MLLPPEEGNEQAILQMKKNETRSRSMKPSVEDRIISRLTEFTEALENNEVISEKFTCRKVQLNLQPTEYRPELVKEQQHNLPALPPFGPDFRWKNLG